MLINITAKGRVKMQLNELIDKQKELNSVIEPYPDTLDHLGMAVMVKCGKVAELLSSEWRWWNVPAKCDRDELISALTDVFKFLLVGSVIFLRWNHSHFWSKNWEDLEDSENWEDLEDSEKNKEIVFYNLCKIPASVDCDCINLFVKVCASLGISRDEIEASYLKLWEQNMQRFKAG